MTELLSPGVFIEEIPSQVQVIAGVSTSSCGFVGFTSAGPTDVATLVTSYESYTRIFGGLTQNSLTPLMVAAYFSNGGQRAYIVRVVPSDATLAECKILSKTTDQEIEVGDGVVVQFVKTDLTTQLKVNSGASPILPDSMNLKWREAQAATSDRLCHQRDGSTPLEGDGAAQKLEGRVSPILPKGSIVAVAQANLIDNETFVLDDGVNPAVTFAFEVTGGYVPVAGEIDVDVTAAVTDIDVADIMVAVINAQANLNLYADNDAATLATVSIQNTVPDPAGDVITWVDTVVDVGFVVTNPTGGFAGVIDEAMFLLVGGAVTLRWWEAGVAKTLPCATKSDRWTYTGASADGTAIIDMRTGIFSLETLIAAPDASTPIEADFTATTVNKTAVDNGLGGFTGDLAVAATSVVDYDDGSYTLDFDVAPHGPAGLNEGSPLLVTYQIEAWDMDPIAKGAWGNDLQVEIKGNLDYFTVGTGQYTRADVNIRRLNSGTGNYDVVEQYEELSLSDSSSTKFYPDVLNDLSDLVLVTEPGGNEMPGELQAVVRSRVIAAGDETTGNKIIQELISEIPVAPRSVVISYTSAVDSLVKTITDDGSGVLTGSIDPAGTNTIVYATGAIDVTTLDLIEANSLVEVAYYTAAEETAHLETFGDTTKGYTQGSDGMFTNYGRDEVTSPVLIPTYAGLYALNRVDEILQVVIPDFAESEVITSDLLDYVDSRTTLPHGGDRFAVLATPSGLTAQEAVDWFKYTLSRFSDFAAIYWPWVTVADPLSDNRDLLMPAIGHVAGIYARTDSVKNVAKAPGGTVDGQLRFVTGLETEPDIQERNVVYPNRINPLISSPQTGRAVWGVRTISNQSDWRYVNVRRLFMFSERSIYESTFWTVFENNGPALWTRIKAQVDGFLVTLFNEGMLAGNNPTEAFTVTVDSSNNSQETIDAGQVIIDVAIAPLKPAEFIRFRVTQKTLQA